MRREASPVDNYLVVQVRIALHGSLGIQHEAAAGTAERAQQYLAATGIGSAQGAQRRLLQHRAVLPVAVTGGQPPVAVPAGGLRAVFPAQHQALPLLPRQRRVGRSGAGGR